MPIKQSTLQSDVHCTLDDVRGHDVVQLHAPSRSALTTKTIVEQIMHQTDKAEERLLHTAIKQHTQAARSRFAMVTYVFTLNAPRFVSRRFGAQ